MTEASQWGLTRKIRLHEIHISRHSQPIDLDCAGLYKILSEAVDYESYVCDVSDSNVYGVARVVGEIKYKVSKSAGLCRT